PQVRAGDARGEATGDAMKRLTPELACVGPDRTADFARSRRRDEGLPGVLRGAATKRSRNLRSEAGQDRRVLGLILALGLALAVAAPAHALAQPIYPNVPPPPVNLDPAAPVVTSA